MGRNNAIAIHNDTLEYTANFIRNIAQIETTCIIILFIFLCFIEREDKWNI